MMALCLHTHSHIHMRTHAHNQPTALPLRVLYNSHSNNRSVLTTLKSEITVLEVRILLLLLLFLWVGWGEAIFHCI